MLKGQLSEFSLPKSDVLVWMFMTKDGQAIKCNISQGITVSLVSLENKVENHIFNVSIVMVVLTSLAGLNTLFELSRMADDAPNRKQTINFCFLCFMLSFIMAIRAFCFES